MNGQIRSGQNTYYDQLGVPANASPEEIREAYRALARLLHPDQQTDPHLKRVAEQQMRKLNPIYTVLSDPVRRRQYDEDLAEEYAPAIVLEGPPAVSMNRIVGRVVWAGAIFVVVGLLYWLASGNSGNPFSSENETRPTIPIFIPQTKAAEQPPAKDSDKTAEVAALQSQIKTLTAERDFAMHELARMKGVSLAPAQTPAAAPPPPAAPAAQDRHAPAVTATTELPAAQPTPPQQHSDSPASKAAAAKPTLAGFWFYAAPKNPQKSKNQNLYLPEYIEATIVEENGVVKGKYRSRFQIADRAAYPEVNFTFTGTPSGSTLTCPWTGQGGAKGEVTMKMMSDNSLRLDWAASELGSQLGLASGTAILTRRID
jgi:hypothetical protein